MAGQINDQNDNHSLHNDQDRPKTLSKHINPIRNSAPSCLVFLFDASDINSKPSITQRLLTFRGFDSESPYLHLREFEEVCHT